MSAETLAGKGGWVGGWGSLLCGVRENCSKLDKIPSLEKHFTFSVGDGEVSMQGDPLLFQIRITVE